MFNDNNMKYASELSIKYNLKQFVERGKATRVKFYNDT